MYQAHSYPGIPARGLHAQQISYSICAVSFSITLKSSWWNSKKGSAIRVPSRRQRWRRLYSQATPQRTNTPHDSFLKHSEATCKRAQQLPTMLGVVSQQCTGRKVWPVSNFAQQHATTSNNMQQGVQTDATCNIQQSWELLVNNVASVCT